MLQEYSGGSDRETVRADTWGKWDRRLCMKAFRGLAPPCLSPKSQVGIPNIKRVTLSHSFFKAQSSLFPSESQEATKPTAFLLTTMTCLCYLSNVPASSCEGGSRLFVNISTTFTAVKCTPNHIGGLQIVLSQVGISIRFNVRPINVAHRSGRWRTLSVLCGPIWLCYLPLQHSSCLVLYTSTNSAALAAFVHPNPPRCSILERANGLIWSSTTYICGNFEKNIYLSG